MSHDDGEKKGLNYSTGEKTLTEMLNEADRPAPHLTPASIEAVVRHEQYIRVPDTTVTVCALTLANGYVVIGKSAAASPENYNEKIGQRVAREDALSQIWALEGYLLREQLAKGEQILRGALGE
jgi:hypothetical protein